MSKHGYALLQHEAALLGKTGFDHCVAVNALTSARERQLVENVGGLTFDDFDTAHRAEYTINYPPNNTDLYATADGNFSPKTIAGRPIYLPTVSERARVAEAIASEA